MGKCEIRMDIPQVFPIRIKYQKFVPEIIIHIDVSIALNIEIFETKILTGPLSHPGNLEKKPAIHIKDKQGGCLVKVGYINPAVSDKRLANVTYQTVDVCFQRDIPDIAEIRQFQLNVPDGINIDCKGCIFQGIVRQFLAGAGLYPQYGKQKE
jgi:hypothetical protein